jgi:hypothetical protein
MTTPSSPGSAPTGPTRQLLDELDALMQRMLALPVEQDGAPSASGETPRPAGAGPALSPPPSLPGRGQGHPPILDMPRPVRADAPARPAPSHLSPPPAILPPRHEVVSTGVATRAGGELQPDAGGPAAFGPEVFANLKVEPPVHRPRPSAARPALPRPERTTSWLPGTLTWINQAFDRGTLWLGPAGRWLRSPPGRAVLGWLGAGLLMAALGWQILAWTGWNW